MQFTRTLLPNGLRLVTVPMRENPTATVLVMVEAGSKYETREISGLSHFLEHLCFKGTARRPRAIDIAHELDAVGAQYNAFTGQEYTGYFAKADAKHVGAMLDIVSDVYLNPALPEPEIEREKGVICEEINMYRDLPHRHVHDVFQELLYGDQPAGWSILGTRETVSAMRREQLTEYRRRHYVSGATLVAVAGNVSAEEVARGVEKAFSAMPRGEKHGKTAVVEAQTGPRFTHEERPTDQTHLVLGVRTTNTYDPRNPSLRVLTGVLRGGMSSRLWQKLREEMGVCYYVDASHDTFTDHGYLSIAAGVDNRRVTDVIKVLLEELGRLCAEEVPASELAKVKDYLTGGLYLSLETSDAVADFVAAREVLRKPLKTPDEAAADIRAVAASDVRDAARTFFRNECLNLALIGPPAASSRLTELLRL